MKDSTERFDRPRCQIIHLRKYFSCCIILSKSGMQDLDLSEEYSVDLTATKALGCAWKAGEDHFRIVNPLTPLKICLRWIMSSRLGNSFDRPGVFSPFFVNTRLILQRLTTEK